MRGVTGGKHLSSLSTTRKRQTEKRGVCDKSKSGGETKKEKARVPETDQIGKK